MNESSGQLRRQRERGRPSKPGLPFAAVASLGILLGACEALRQPAEPNPVLPSDTVRTLTQQEREVAAAANRFAFDLLREANAAEHEKPNLLLSPLSVSMALGMTLNGAAGSTFDAMRSTLGFDALSPTEINAAYYGLIRQLRARDVKVEWKLANSLWVHNTFPVYPTFTDSVRHYFGAEVRQLDFKSAGAPQTISQWAEQNTGGRVKNLITQIDPLEVMFLVNAVYFKAPWTKAFEPAATTNQPFTRADGSVVNVPMMMQDATYRYVVNERVKAVELLYADSAYSMVLWMGPKGPALDDAVPLLTEARWNEMLAAMEPGRLMLRVPKFKFEYEADLKALLSTLGMAIAFVPERADFTRIANRDDIYLTRVKHKAYIDVHERGTEAAAATAVGVGVTSLPPQLDFDRPFFFAIRERSTGTILFSGRVIHPGA